MSGIVTPASIPGPPHPLASLLAGALAASAGARVAVLGFGSGRNLPILIARGVAVDVVEEDPTRRMLAIERYREDPRVRVLGEIEATDAPQGPYAGALSTHALLHGTPHTVRAAVARMRIRLAVGAPFFFTLGSKRDPRFGAGIEIAPDSYAPSDGPEAGIAHAYFDQAGATALLSGYCVDELEEGTASETAGAWAHTDAELATMRHWFVRARRAPD